MLTLHKSNLFLYLLILLLVHQSKSNEANTRSNSNFDSSNKNKNDKLINSEEKDLIKAESQDNFSEIELNANNNKQTLSPLSNLHSSKLFPAFGPQLFAGNNPQNTHFNLNLFKQLPSQSFGNAATILQTAFHNPSSTLAKATALIKPRALSSGSNFAQRFPNLIGPHQAVSSSQIGPVFSSNNIQPNHLPQINSSPNPPQQQNNHANILNGPQNNHIFQNLPPTSFSENTIDINDLNAPFYENHVSRNKLNEQFQGGPPPPPSPTSQANSENVGDNWSLNNPKQIASDKPKIQHLDVKCEKNSMKIVIEFDKPFNGIIFSKGHFSFPNCVHLQPNSGRSSAKFDISITQCGTIGNTQNGLYGYGATSGSGTYFENTVVIQYDPQVQEAWDIARKLRCTWHDQYEKAVTFRPFPVDMLDVVKADFAGDNVGCWMQIQVGKGPWASEVAGIVKIGQTMTMVLAIKDEENKFDMLVRNCIAHDGERAPIELVDGNGCITRPKLMSRFTKIKNFGNSATVLSYAHFQAFKFPDSMEVHFQCTIQICRFKCPEQCSKNGNNENDQHFVVNGKFENQRPSNNGPGDLASAASETIANENDELNVNPQMPNPSALLVKPRSKRDVSKQLNELDSLSSIPDSKEVGLNRMIQVVSKGDLAFSLNQTSNRLNGDLGEDLGNMFNVDEETIEGTDEYVYQQRNRMICMSGFYFFTILFALACTLLISCCGCTIFFIKHRTALQKVKSKCNGSVISGYASDLYSVLPYDVCKFKH